MSQSVSIQFLGAAPCVTGSKYLLRTPGITTLVDCGLFQGLKELRLRNWEPLPFPPAQIDQVFLTHAHIDHTGYLPRLRKDGFNGPVYCTPSTAELLSLLLPDCGHLQEEDARSPRKVFLVHGEADGLNGLRMQISDHLKWPTHIPNYLERAELRPE